MSYHPAVCNQNFVTILGDLRSSGNGAVFQFVPYSNSTRVLIVSISFHEVPSKFIMPNSRPISIIFWQPYTKLTEILQCQMLDDPRDLDLRYKFDFQSSRKVISNLLYKIAAKHLAPTCICCEPPLEQSRHYVATNNTPQCMIRMIHANSKSTLRNYQQQRMVFLLGFWRYRSWFKGVLCHEIPTLRLISSTRRSWPAGGQFPTQRLVYFFGRSIGLARSDNEGESPQLNITFNAFRPRQIVLQLSGFS